MLYKRHAERVLSVERKREPLHLRVKDVLRHEVDLGFVKAPPIARRLGVTPRAFRRRLSVEGHSLTELADEVRRELSFEALSESALPIKQIADRVGFGEVSAFHRAFKRWTNGITPARYRSEAVVHAPAHTDALTNVSTIAPASTARASVQSSA